MVVDDAQDLENLDSLCRRLSSETECAADVRLPPAKAVAIETSLAQFNLNGAAHQDSLPDDHEQVEIGIRTGASESLGSENHQGLHVFADREGLQLFAETLPMDPGPSQPSPADPGL